MKLQNVLLSKIQELSSKSDLKKCLDRKKDIPLSVIKAMHPKFFKTETVQNKKEIENPEVLRELLKKEILNVLIKKLTQNQVKTEYNEKNLNNSYEQQSSKSSMVKKNDCYIYEKTKEIVAILIEKIGSYNFGEIKGEIFEKFSEMRNFQAEFDILLMKFVSIKKTKEEKIKFLLRKCFKFLKKKFISNCLTPEKEVNETFANYYFSKEVSSVIMNNDSFKILNNEYLRSLFSSEKFNEDFKDFLGRIYF